MIVIRYLMDLRASRQTTGERGGIYRSRVEEDCLFENSSSSLDGWCRLGFLRPER